MKNPSPLLLLSQPYGGKQPYRQPYHSQKKHQLRRAAEGAEAVNRAAAVLIMASAILANARIARTAGDNMNKKTIFLIAIVIVSAMFISGCTQQTTIKNSEEVGTTVTNISQDVGDVTSTLQDIDSSLGG